MNSITKLESAPALTQNPTYTKQTNPYARMSNRRAIACTICAKAKTKCDKALPSCSRCTAKGLPCEPRWTRRTSDSNYRNPKKHLVSPKRFPSANTVPTLSRHTSPRSVPSSNGNQLTRTHSQMDFHTAAKMAQRTDFASLNMLTPLPTQAPYTPQIVDEFHSYSSSPEQNMMPFSQPMEKSGFLASGRLTPQTPDSFPYPEHLTMAEPFDPYMNAQPWSDDGQMPIGLGFENDMPGMMPGDMWSTPEPESHPNSMGFCDSPSAMGMWPPQGLSVSPPQIPHTRSVPSLALSDGSHDYDSPEIVQGEWSSHHQQMHMMKPNTSGAYIEDLKAMSTNPSIWDDAMLTRSGF
ncbi:hypothetical protein BS50DRAFT_264687 [Corynespora cassiicola Philippines]|uniref:Zn(2)-C6 fungal-type domain-containing protein n=1 Tax=Corynespora cassiicola Philippines TaxID=1448308 RepID=A0A2T2NYW8_CORCC|nr:hypothetical protein BS50DRAFT_264687 [Corynespora cassiicola Philippines]